MLMPRCRVMAGGVVSVGRWGVTAFGVDYATCVVVRTNLSSAQRPDW